jgi:glycosyltransferase involved in cell wall biosynthesis
VIACEISALSTFRAARRLGLVTLLDAPSFHHATQDRVQPTLDSPRLHRRINQVKDEEFSLADHVLTVSELARESYVEGGKPEQRVHAIALGADLELFHPRREPRVEPSREGNEVSFLFAGAAIHRKGFDLLIEAFRLLPGEAAARLRIVGPGGDALTALGAADRRVTRLGPLDQEGVAAELRGADCLVLPSRHDSFGMVVPEALASGTPAIVSSMVGAKDLIAEDVTGWVVPLDDVAALAARMLWCVRNPARLRAMREDCRNRAAAATWEDYHRRIAELVGELVTAARQQQPPRLAKGSAA